MNSMVGSVSPAMQRALDAVDTYGFAAVWSGSWTNIPPDAMAYRVTLDALVRRGLVRWDTVDLPNESTWPCVVKEEGESPDE